MRDTEREVRAEELRDGDGQGQTAEVTTATPPVPSARAGAGVRADGRARRPQPGLAGWLEERVGVNAFYKKYGRKAFPVHTTFFLGEMATFSFVILVLTGAYLGLIYVPSNAVTTVNGEELPQAYASARLIESIPVANIFRNVHHWCAHLMIASVLLHSLRIFFTGTYRKPREINWVNGVVLLVLTLVISFVGYSLPYDAYAVTATGIGYSIARSIPFVGNIAAELFFGGAFPSPGSLPRLYTIHVFIMPLLISAIIGLHLLLVIKQKHTMPGYARKVAEPGKVLGVPLWPYQAILAGQLILLMFGGLLLLSAFVQVHPLEAYGPPGPETPEVKPDWYLLWVYGLLEIMPSSLTISTPIATIGPEFLAGILFPGIIFGIMTLVPWLDRTNRRATRRYEYLEPPRQAPMRLALGVAMLTYIGMLSFAAFHNEAGLGGQLGAVWALTLAVPLIVGSGVFLWAKQTANYREADFDPTAEDTDVTNAPAGAGAAD